MSIAMLGGLLGLGINSSAVAREFTADECLINSRGGLHVKYSDDDSYWMSVVGMGGFDQSLYMGSYRDKAVDPASGSNPIPGIVRRPYNAFPNSANIRGLLLGVAGGLGPHWSYILSFATKGRKIRFDDSYITYCGFCDNLKLSVGHVPGQFFGLDNSTSMNWIPFMERNLAAEAFAPHGGLGVMLRYGWCDGSFLGTAFQPGPHESVFDAHVLQRSIVVESQTLPIPRDYWTMTGRLTFSPLHTECDVYHFGVSAVWQEQPTSIRNTPVYGKRFRTFPDVRGRSRGDGIENTTARLVDTGHLRANYIRQFNIEFARQWNALLIDGEYNDVYVHRVGDPEGALNFTGWNIQGRYMLTGERRNYDVEFGNFCSLCPNNEFGAVELAVRYDVVNLNNKNLVGGREYNATVGVNWFINDNVRLTANYIRADIHPGTAAAIAENVTPNVYTRHLDIIALRAAFRF